MYSGGACWACVTQAGTVLRTTVGILGGKEAVEPLLHHHLRGSAEEHGASPWLQAGAVL